MTRRILIICGILSSLVYLITDIIGGTRWENYSWLSQEFSRLSAIGAPVKTDSSRTEHYIFIACCSVWSWRLAVSWQEQISAVYWNSSDYLCYW